MRKYRKLDTRNPWELAEDKRFWTAVFIWMVFCFVLGLKAQDWWGV